MWIIDIRLNIYQQLLWIFNSVFNTDICVIYCELIVSLLQRRINIETMADYGGCSDIPIGNAIGKEPDNALNSTIGTGSVMETSPHTPHGTS